MLARLICTVCVPLLTGAALYFIPTFPFIKNYLADGLWAFALVSLLCMIWENKVPKIYLLLSF